MVINHLQVLGWSSKWVVFFFATLKNTQNKKNQALGVNIQKKYIWKSPPGNWIIAGRALGTMVVFKKIT